MTADDRYKGEDGGLYGGGINHPPAILLAAVKSATAAIQPLDGEGKPAVDGQIALVSISMSNATQEFSRFKQLADADLGDARSPLLLWGPYLWADGVKPRKGDGLNWQRSDFVSDGTHPSDTGRQKVADQLRRFFKTDPFARTWFAKP